MDTAKGRERSPKPPANKQLPDRSLPRVLDRIRRDALDHAERYLHESEVPSEGE
jgi:hypothetical protein